MTARTNTHTHTNTKRNTMDTHTHTPLIHRHLATTMGDLSFIVQHPLPSSTKSYTHTHHIHTHILKLNIHAKHTQHVVSGVNPPRTLNF